MGHLLGVNAEEVWRVVKLLQLILHSTPGQILSVTKSDPSLNSRPVSSPQRGFAFPQWACGQSETKEVALRAIKY